MHQYSVLLMIGPLSGGKNKVNSKFQRIVKASQGNKYLSYDLPCLNILPKLNNNIQNIILFSLGKSRLNFGGSILY